MNAAWLTPGAVLLGCGMIAVAISVGASRVTRALEAQASSTQARPSPSVAGGTFALSPSHPPAADAPPAAVSGGVVELPIVTYDSFDRRFAGKLQAEAEKKCWAPAEARGVVEDIVYLYLDIAVDGSVERVETEEPPPAVQDPNVPKLRELHECVARVAKLVRFMPLPARVQHARVAAHRHATSR